MSELFVEVRCEELPARFVGPAIGELAERIGRLLSGVEHGELRAWATPRRLAVAVSDVAQGRPVEEQLVTGPPEQAAFRNGEPTRVALGFARGRGVAVEDLEIVETPRGRVVAVRVRKGGEKTVDIVAAGLEEAILGVSFARSMRWDSNPVRWGRPIHGVVALFDGEVVRTTVAGIQTGATTLGHRLTPGPIEITSAGQWVQQLRLHHVEPDRAARREAVRSQLVSKASELKAALGPEADGLIDQVCDLVEWPVVIVAEFSPDLLDLPPRLLIESMTVHQRVFPLYRDGELAHQFLVVTNQPRAVRDDVAHIIADGNARVLAARFHDARFFFAEDRKKPLEVHAQALADMQWIRSGGTMLEKSERVSVLSGRLADIFGADAKLAVEAARLCKADLATQMVGEFPELEGHVGRLLAQHDGLPERVALAIEEHYLPRFSGDALPSTPEGRTVAVADRIDTLVGCFARGLAPKGSADPLGLRRAAHGLVQVLLDARARVELEALFSEGGLRDPEALVEFTLARLRAQLAERWSTEVVDAVMATGDTDVVALAARADALGARASTPEFGALKTTFKRVMGLSQDHVDAIYDIDAMHEPVERRLAHTFDLVKRDARAQGDHLDYAGALDRLTSLKPLVDQFFDEVYVMADDPAVRVNRLGLLRAIADEFRRVADLTRLSAE